MFFKVQVLQKLCAQLGAKGTSKFAKNDAIAFLRKKLNIPEHIHYKKIFIQRSGEHQVAEFFNWIIEYSCNVILCNAQFPIFAHGKLGLQ